MIRNDFVSNSSSTSFMIVGYCADQDKISARIKEIAPDYKYSWDDLYAMCSVLIKKTDSKIGFEQELGDYPEYCYFGYNYCDMKKDETREQFENRILKEVQKIFPDATKKDIQYECQGGYDG